MIDCDELMGRKVLGKVVNRKGGVKRGNEKKERKTGGVRTFHSSHDLLQVYTRTTGTAASARRHFPHQFRSFPAAISN